MFSPRYLAEHLLLPRHLREKGGAAALDAIARRDEWFFVPVWMEAGFRFTPQMVHVVREDFRVGVISLPRPREDTEAFLAAIVGRLSDPAWWRYFLLESGVSVVDGSPITAIGEWAGGTHRNFGSGPPFTGNAEDDIASFVERVLEICRPA
jgi:hypothetical protein